MQEVYEWEALNISTDESESENAQFIKEWELWWKPFEEMSLPVVSTKITD